MTEQETTVYSVVIKQSIETTVKELNQWIELINAEVDHYRSVVPAGHEYVNGLRQIEEMLCGLGPMLEAVSAIIADVNRQEGR